MMRAVTRGRVVVRPTTQRVALSTTVRIAALPSEVGDSSASQKVVLIDVQRATSTIVTAFANGLRRARILAEVELVRQAAETEENPLLGGERDFVKIDGFDVDNSPLAYTEAVARGRSLLFTSTNGARALSAVDGHDVVLGSFLNEAATRRYCAAGGDVLLLCSGTHGERSDEDELFAGAIAAYLREAHGFGFADRLTHDLVDVATHAAAFPDFWHRIMRHSKNAVGLAANGLAHDLAFVSQVDKFPTILPRRPPGHLYFHNDPSFADDEDSGGEGSRSCDGRSAPSS